MGKAFGRALFPGSGCAATLGIAMREVRGAGDQRGAELECQPSVAVVVGRRKVQDQDEIQELRLFRKRSSLVRGQAAGLSLLTQSPHENVALWSKVSAWRFVPGMCGVGHKEISSERKYGRN